MHITKTTATIASAVLLAAIGLTAIGTGHASANATACTPSWQQVARLQLLDKADSVSMLAPGHPVIGFYFGNGMGWEGTWTGTTIRALPSNPAMVPSGRLGGSRSSFDSAGDGWMLLSARGPMQQQGAGGFSLAEHWHGGRWQLTPTAVLPDFVTAHRFASPDAVDALSPADAWIVGHYDQLPNAVGALAEHWDGSAWTIVPNPAENLNGTALSAVAAASSDDVWAVGYQTAAGSTTAAPLAEHWDGTQLQSVALPPPAAGVTGSGLSAVAVSGHQVWAMGYQVIGSSFYPLIDHFDGTSWQQLPLMTGLAGLAVVAVYASAAGDVWAITTNSVTGVPASSAAGGFLHWDGKSWSIIAPPGPQEAGLGYSYTAIAGTGPDDIWAVGEADDSADDGFSPIVARLTC